MAKRFVEGGLIRKIRQIVILRRRAGIRWPCSGSRHRYSHVVAPANNLDPVHDRNVIRFPIAVNGQTRRSAHYRTTAAKSDQLCVGSVAVRAVATFDGDEIAAVKCDYAEIIRILIYSLLRAALRNPVRRSCLLALCRRLRRRIRASSVFEKILLRAPIACWPGKARPGTFPSLGLTRPQTASAGLNRRASRNPTERRRSTAWGCAACPCSFGKGPSW
ncbi:hypothetical protein FBZ93_116176 [Bradyrhizobium macuxiense]|uniref:Uncharacterized protein n=1 Tax=Bradyrhizobium macuxiense TaxID=1755647 RepID=A0A560L261_9BRAD|nr:hypothetical protein FBZ93_116176 [Bradyrhizobium macuxiense]